VRVDIRPGTTVKIDENEGIAFWDDTTCSIVVASAFASDRVSVLRQLAHRYILDPEISLSRAYYAIESGLATYFSCSFRKHPKLGDQASAAGKRISPPVDLRNRRQFSEIKLDRWESVQNDGSEIWGGAFWQVRELLGEENADRLLSQTWRDLSPGKQEGENAYRPSRRVSLSAQAPLTILGCEPCSRSAACVFDG
jgi:hypothetical protein